MGRVAVKLLTPQEIAELTDIRTGKGGKTREQLQIEALRSMKIPYFVSAIGRPKVAQSVIEGGRMEQKADTWSPSLA
jgi:hypothetical protein